MPPKRARSKSPAKATAAPGKAPAKKAVAGASAVAAAAAKPKAKAASGKPPAVEKAPAAGTNAASKPAIAEGDAVVLLQRFGRGFSDRVFAGARHKRMLQKQLEDAADNRLSKLYAHERKRRQADGAVNDKATDAAERRRKLQEDLCLASFDGNVAGMRRALAAGANVLKKDGQGNFAIGEAAVNGQVEAIQVLLDNDADPNCRGEYGRTPLWRAAFNSRTDAIKLLLEAGADPREAAQSQLPVELASGDAQQLLKDWDVAKTDKLRATADKRRQDKEAAEAAQMAKELQNVQDGLQDAKSKYEAVQRELFKAKQDYEARILEYDTVHHEGKKPELVEIALTAVKDAEAKIGAITERYDAAQDAYLTLRTEEAAVLQAQMKAQGDEIDSIEVPFMQISETVINDAEKRYKNIDGGKWPMLIDVSGKAAVFLRYRDTNFVDACHPKGMEPESVRKSLVGALRYGKPLVIDLRDVPMIDFVIEAFNSVRPKLWDEVMSKAVMQPASYAGLIRPTDGEAYGTERWTAAATAGFTLLVVSSALYVDDGVLKDFVVYRTPTD